MSTFERGDAVEILTHDNKVFRGPLAYWNHQYVVIGCLGFPLEDVKVMLHA